MKIHLFASQQELDAFAAGLFIQLVKDKPQAVLGLATGSTPIGIYEQLRSAHAAQGVSFKDVRTFNLDEYVGLPPSHDQSYAYYMQQHLFSHIDARPDRTHLPDGMADDLQAECARYDSLLAANPIDIQLLGVGHNGHIGFNEPAAELSNGTHVVQLEEKTLNANARFFSSIDEVPKQAITMGVGAILRSQTIILAARGEDKAAIIEEALTGPITTACPASLLQTHADVIVLLDHAAGRRLSTNGRLNLVHS